MVAIAIIPAYNECGTIGSIITQVLEHVPEVIVVDDGSDDNTAEVASRAGATVLSRSANLGIGRSLSAAYEVVLYGGYEVIVQIDADGQHDPAYIPQLISTVEGGKDLVVASRYLASFDASTPAWRVAGIRFYSKLLSFLTGTRVTDATSGFRALSAGGLKSSRDLPTRHWAIYQTLDYLLRQLAYEEVPVRMRPRRQGSSHFTTQAALLYHLKVATAIFPLLLEGSGEEASVRFPSVQNFVNPRNR